MKTRDDGVDIFGDVDELVKTIASGREAQAYESIRAYNAEMLKQRVLARNPPARKPLTLEQLEQLLDQRESSDMGDFL